MKYQHEWGFTLQINKLHTNEARLECKVMLEWRNLGTKSKKPIIIVYSDWAQSFSYN